MKMSEKKILSLTLNRLLNVSLEDMLDMLKNNLDEINDYSSEYALSITSAIVKRVLLIKNFSHQYKKFYRVITSDVFRKNKFVYECLEKENLSNLKALYDIYDKYQELIDSIFSDNEKIFDEIVIDEKFNIEDLFSKSIIDSFKPMSYKVFLSHLLKGNDKNRVIKALIKSRNNEFVYMVSKMDDIVLKYTKDDNEYFDAVLTLLNYNNYRRLLWDYYNRYVRKKEHDKGMNRNKDIPEILYKLLSYTFFLMNSKYTNDKVFDIAPSIEEMLSSISSNKDMMHISVFGVDGYNKVKDKTFDKMFDFIKIDDDNKLLNLKIAFFSTIYGVTYNQAEKLIRSFDDVLDEIDGPIHKDDKLTYETMMAMKSLYELTLDDKESIDLYREVYYKYLNKNGIYCDVEIQALVIMESLMRRMYNNSIEII